MSMRRSQCAFIILDGHILFSMSMYFFQWGVLVSMCICSASKSWFLGRAGLWVVALDVLGVGLDAEGGIGVKFNR